MSKNIMERFWSLDEATSDDLHSAMRKGIGAIIEYFNSPYAAKENLIKTDMKVANTVLTTFARIRQAESGMVQAVTVVGDRAGKSEEFRAMISDNLPQISLPKKQLKK